MTKYRLLTILLIVLASAIAYAWTEPMRLTEHRFAMHPQAAAIDSNLYVACWGPGGIDFPYLYSWDNGFSWSDPIQPADTFARDSETPDIEYTPNGLLHVVWLG